MSPALGAWPELTDAILEVADAKVAQVRIMLEYAAETASGTDRPGLLLAIELLST